MIDDWVASCNLVPLWSAFSNFGVGRIFLIRTGVWRKSAEWADEIRIFFFFYFLFSVFWIQSKWSAILSILHMSKVRSLKAQVKKEEETHHLLWKLLFHKSAEIMIITENLPFTVCLDGSPPAYHLSPGFGIGVDNWLVQFEVRNLEICSL